MRNTAFSTAIALIAVLIFSGSVLAGKPSSSLSLVLVPTGELVALSSTEPAQGGQVTFDVATTQSDRPFVNVRCYQDDSWVYDGWHGFFESYAPNPVYTLSSLSWTAAAADCTATLVTWGRNGTWKTLAVMTFHVTD